MMHPLSVPHEPVQFRPSAAELVVLTYVFGNQKVVS